MGTEVRTDYSMTASPGEVLPIIVRGEGCWLEDTEGRRYLDACGGAMVSILGHTHPRVVEALERQARQLAFTYRFSFRNEPMLDLAERIARIAPGDLEWAFFNSSGSEANESAMHLAILYWQLLGRPEKRHFLSRASSYHGSTLGALSLSGRYREPFEDLLHPYAAVANRSSAEEGLRALEREIEARGADTIAAFVIEPVTGSSGAAIELPPGYLEGVRAICDEHEILLVADEVVTAFGRTGRWFACEHEGVTPDVITFGKGIGGGIVPLSGMVASRRLREVVGSSPTGFGYGHTFSGYPLGCAVGCAVIDTVEADGLVEASATRGARLRAGLEELATRHPSVAEVRGKGLVLGIELRDPRSGEAFRAGSGVAARATALAKERELMIYSCPATLPERHVEAVLLAPPMIISDAEIDEVLGRLDAALDVLEREL
jgi:adenosylmethionine-8-amino-7-oxononanoate aminotransferase